MPGYASRSSTTTVAWVTLAAPERRNAQSPATWTRLTEIGAALPPSVRVAYCARRARRFPRVSIAASCSGMAHHPSVAGAIGRCRARQSDRRLPGGVHLVDSTRPDHHRRGPGARRRCRIPAGLACDLRVLADDATLQMKEVTLGLVPDLCGTKRLVDLVGFPVALEMCVTGRWVDARNALELRLANLVVPRADLQGAVDDLVAAVLASPPEMRYARRRSSSLAASSRTLDDQRAAERRAQAPLLRALARRP